MGRNYDYEQSYKETIINIPYEDGNSIIGVCTGLIEDYPLLYDGMNEKGLCCSALAFTGNACYDYEDTSYRKYKLPAYDFVRHILANCDNVTEAQELLQKTDIVNINYNDKFPNSPLHWFICDKDETITVESTTDGLHIYPNPYEVLTNNPPFPLMVNGMLKQNSLIGTYNEPEGEYQTRGTETYGILGDTTSMSRFQRIKQYKDMMMESDTPFKDTDETFHLLGTVEQVYGATPVKDNYEYTIYSAVYDMENLKLYIRTYNGQIIKETFLQRKKKWRILI